MNDPSLNHSQQTIESTTHCLRHTVRSVLQAAKENQITWPLDDDITNAELEEFLFPGKYKIGCRYVEPDYKACASLTKLGGRYGRERLENDSNRFGITRGASYFRKGGER